MSRRSNLLSMRRKHEPSNKARRHGSDVRRPKQLSSMVVRMRQGIGSRIALVALLAIAASCTDRSVTTRPTPSTTRATPAPSGAILGVGCPPDGSTPRPGVAIDCVAEIQLNGGLITVADGLTVQPGYIGLQGEGGQLEFKNIRVKELK